MSTYLGSEFGLRGTFIDNDGEAQDPEAPRHPRWIGMTQQDLVGVPANYFDISVEDAARQELKPPIVYRNAAEASKAYARRAEHHEMLCSEKNVNVDIQMHNILWSHTSIESREIIERLPEFEESSHKNKNPYWLYEAMKKTHFLEPTGMSIFDKKRLELEWSTFRMRDNEVSALGACKKRYSDLMDRVEACGITIHRN